MCDAVSIRHLTKNYKDFCLDNFSLTVKEGHVAGLVGSNGAGKTTALKSLFAAYKPEKGEVVVRGQKLQFGDEQHAGLKAEMAFVFDTAPYGACKVKAVEKIGVAAYPSFDIELFRSELAKAHISLQANANKLSRGMSMRLQLAFALAHHPSILVLDEPTAGLDPMATQDVLDDFRVFMEDPTHAIIYSTHDIQDIESIADTITCLDNGRTIFSTSLEDIQTEYGLLHLTKEKATNLVHELSKKHITCYSETHALNASVLVLNVERAKHAFSHAISFERPHVDEVMNLMIRGEKHGS